MFDEFSDGYCPQCFLDDKKIPLVQNNMDFWECPECRLQCHTCTLSVLSIMRKRGDGRLNDILAIDWVKRCILSRADKNVITLSDGSTFKNEQELRDFLLSEVKSFD
jgi:Zn ribbon nucleic-acid-binding protein